MDSDMDKNASSGDDPVGKLTDRTEPLAKDGSKRNIYEYMNTVVKVLNISSADHPEVPAESSLDGRDLHLDEKGPRDGNGIWMTR
ncbi:hypothetical protein ZHAS_00004906 [Anopheles sinensis]|uniref:Uncharacterized protein n=1 Tax=Anopheles sinensis TaxID=74873 RepID=A0A084VI72_ANOSI|nr:hypothetical protein ZHAS_00004906 [Anopheles sinensis]